jgi:hypothetical protein
MPFASLIIKSGQNFWSNFLNLLNGQLLLKNLVISILRQELYNLYKSLPYRLQTPLAVHPSLPGALL